MTDTRSEIRKEFGKPDKTQYGVYEDSGNYEDIIDEYNHKFLGNNGVIRVYYNEDEQVKKVVWRSTDIYEYDEIINFGKNVLDFYNEKYGDYKYDDYKKVIIWEETNTGYFWMISHNDNNDLLVETLKNLQDVENADDMGLTYLHVAAINHELDAIKILLEKGANPNRVDKRGMTPLEHAVGSINKNNAELLREFLKYGADLNMMMGDMTIKERIYEFELQDLIDVIEEFEKSLN